MNKVFVSVLAILVLAFGCSIPTEVNRAAAQERAAAVSGFHISGGKLVDANGKVFIMQGINHAHAWFKSTSATVLPQIRAKNANTVRIALSNGTNPEMGGKDSLQTVKDLIALAKQKTMVSMLEVHDTTGYGEKGGATSLDTAANYWIEIKDALIGQEKYVLVNIGNEPYGNNNYGGWVADTKAAISKMRQAQIRNTIVVDAPNWGQDWSGTMKSNARAIFDSDPDKNILFSVHMYEVYPTATEVDAYIQTFVNAGLPLVVGELATQHSGKPVAASAILSSSKAKVNGYIGWSWTGNSGEINADQLDMVRNGNANDPTPWGTLLFNDLKSAKVASVFASTPTPSAAPSPTPTSTPQPPSSGFNVTYSKSDWTGGFTATVRITNNSSSAVTNGWILQLTFGGNQKVGQSWGATYSQSGNQVQFVNVDYNKTIPVGATVELGFTATYTGSNSNPTQLIVKRR